MLVALVLRKLYLCIKQKRSRSKMEKKHETVNVWYKEPLTWPGMRFSSPRTTRRGGSINDDVEESCRENQRSQRRQFMIPMSDAITMCF